jgi:hypothetical protein
MFDTSNRIWWGKSKKSEEDKEAADKVARQKERNLKADQIVDIKKLFPWEQELMKRNPRAFTIMVNRWTPENIAERRNNPEKWNKLKLDWKQIYEETVELDDVKKMKKEARQKIKDLEEGITEQERKKMEILQAKSEKKRLSKMTKDEGLKQTQKQISIPKGLPVEHKKIVSHPTIIPDLKIVHTTEHEIPKHYDFKEEAARHGYIHCFQGISEEIKKRPTCGIALNDNIKGIAKTLIGKHKKGEKYGMGEFLQDNNIVTALQRKGAVGLRKEFKCGKLVKTRILNKCPS